MSAAPAVDDTARYAVYEALDAGRAVVQVDRIVNEDDEAAYRVTVLGIYLGLGLPTPGRLGREHPGRARLPVPGRRGRGAPHHSDALARRV